MLNHPTYHLVIEQALKEYLSLNTSPDMPSLTLWEAHKPVLHGIFQRQFALFKREHKILARKLESEFNTAFISFQDNPSLVTKSHLDKARLAYDLFLTESVDKSFKHSRRNYFMKSNKSGTNLAYTLNSLNKSFKPIRLKLSKDVYMSNPVKIVQKFHSHLASLYSMCQLRTLTQMQQMPSFLV